ncbi:MAG: hypothetical protein ACI4EF_11980 [Coprococcus sp.]
MPEKMCEVYEAYDMEVMGYGRGRGAIILKTDKGIRQVSPLTGSEKRLEEEKIFKEELYAEGFTHIDRVVATQDGELVTYDRYGNPYVLREFFEGRECSPSSAHDLERAAVNLAEFHECGRNVYMGGDNQWEFKSPGNFKGKTQEMKKIRSFISRRSTKNEFELLYMKAYDYFYEQAIKCQQVMEKTDTSKQPFRIGYCHGGYNYHSVIFCDDYMATTNFDRFHIGYQLMDLYQYIRKVMEKNSYNFNLIVKIISEYEKVAPLGREGYEFIYMMYCYPEKFWKISNRYMNSKKSWISPANMEKLMKVIEDEQEKIKILKEFSQYYRVHNVIF